jgi:hypothetical protein
LPGESCTCTSTRRASIPSKATVETRVTMPALSVTERSLASVRRENK